MEKRPLVIVKGRTIEVFLPDGFNLVVNGEAMVGEASSDSEQLSAPQDYMSGMPPGSEPQVIVVPQMENETVTSLPPPAAPQPLPNGTFFEMFENLRYRIPRSGLQCVNNENSPYCQYTEESKNCYMTFASYYSEDCLYNTRVLYCRDCMDNSFLTKCELCYE